MTDVREQLQKTLSGTYTVERELGGGGMSRVFVARDVTLERPVVVKVLSPELAAGVSTERFMRETKVAASLQQANIVPVLAAGVTGDGLPYYTMPYVEGQSLRSRLAKGGAMTITEIIGIMRDVSKALAYAHERGIVHRDIKPDNVLISGGTAVVTDFGIAKALTAARTDSGQGTLTQLGTAIGTPAYMAPEQAAGDPDVDRRADIYSLGCLIYELLTGQSPFHGRSPARMMAAHMGEVPTLVTEHRPDTPVALAALVMRCLDKDPATRPQNAQDVVHALDSVTSGGSTPGLPSILIGGPGMLKKALAFYAAAFVFVAILARAAIMVIGLPDWVFPGALIVMALGLPVILFTAYVARVNRQVAALTPQYTPGGTLSLTHGTIATLALKATPHVSWRRTALGGTYALVGFALIVGAFMTLRAMGIGPAGSLMASGKMRASELTLVTDFKVTNADSSLGRVLGDATKTTLSQSKVIKLATPEAVAGALRRMERPPTTTLLFPLARELAMRNNIRVIVDGEVTGLGAAGFIVTLKLVTTDSMRELASFRESASDAKGLIVAIDNLSRSLRGKIGESLKSVRATMTLYGATTSSLDALRKYSEGARVAELEANPTKAIALLREAVAIDTTFAEAYRKIAIVMSNAQMPRAAIDSFTTKAYRFSNRLSGSERDFVVAAYFNNGPGRDRGKAIAAYESMLARGDTDRAANNLALALVSRREFARAESLYRAQDRACPGCFRPLYGNLGSALGRQGKFAAADSIYRAVLTVFNDAEAVTTSSRLRWNLLNQKGDTGEFRRVVDSVFAKGDSNQKFWARGVIQGISLRNGKPSEWRRSVYALRPDSAKATPQQRLNWALNFLDAWNLAVVEGQPQVVERRLDAALAGFRMASVPVINRPYLDAAYFYALAGRPEKARKLMAEFDALPDTAYRRDMASDRSGVMGAIAEAERKYDDAIAAYRAGDRDPDGPASSCNICLSAQLARAFDLSGKTDSALKYYEEYITTFGWDHPFYDQAYKGMFLKRLGELYEQKGDLAKASKYYRDFVNQWKNADASLQPQVAEVGRRISRIADIEKKP